MHRGGSVSTTRSYEVKIAYIYYMVQDAEEIISRHMQFLLIRKASAFTNKTPKKHFYATLMEFGK